MKSTSFLAYSLLLWSSTQTAAFQSTSLPFSRPTVVGQRMAATARSLRENSEEENFLLDEFKTASGEIVNPYKLLKVPRDADRAVIRQSYRKLSRVYHPDGARHRTILPGSCNNLDDVRDHWERVKLSYEILSEPRTRRRYDRHELLSDPGAALQRTALGAVGKGIKGMGKGIFGMAAFAVKSVAGDDKKEES